VLREAYKPGVASAGGKGKIGRVAKLPGTAIEAALVRDNLPKVKDQEPLLYSESYALESVAKTLRRPQMALFSTHGFFLSDQRRAAEKSLASANAARSVAMTAAGRPFENPLLRCGLLFAGCNPRNAGEPGQGDDGVLTGIEVLGIDFRGTELVVLSACESGIGAVNTGEGIAGLRQAFQLAGAKSVLATLWQIPDRDSALLMNDFFSKLAAGETKAEALRQAQVARIQARRERFGEAQAYYWAAWTVTGK
jgi:CHAT domain-containing protein